MIASLLSSGNAHMTGLITAESSAEGSNFHGVATMKKSLLGINSRALASNDCVSELVKGSAAYCKRLGFAKSVLTDRSGSFPKISVTTRASVRNGASCFRVCMLTSWEPWTPWTCTLGQLVTACRSECNKRLKKGRYLCLNPG